MNEIFGTDGIRCVANSGYLTLDGCEKIVSAVIKVQNPKSVLIGQDTRLSGDMFSHAIAAAFVSYGVDVVLIGVCPTPSISYLTKTFNYDLGVVISASHNPYQDNGIKFFDTDGNKFSEEVEKEIELLIRENQKPEPAIFNKIAKIRRNHSILDSYEKFLVKTVARDLDLSQYKIVIDCANGALSEVAPRVFSNFCTNIVTISNSPNGTNINSECGVTNPDNISKAVKLHNADIGISFDGDGDRVLFCDENGEIVDGDHLLGFLAKNIYGLKSAAITIMSNMALESFLYSLDMRVIKTPVGDKHISQKILEGKTTFGGEKSGHIIIGNYVSTGDGLLAALFTLEQIRKCYPNKLSEIMRTFCLYPSCSINVPVKNKDIIDINELKHFIKSHESDSKKVLVRKSGTENLIRILVECEGKQKASLIAMSIEEKIKKYDR